MEFQQVFVSDLEGRVRDECNCEPFAEIEEVRFAPAMGGGRRLNLEASPPDGHDVTVDANVYEADAADTKAAAQRCDQEDDCTLGGSTVREIMAEPMDGGAAAARLYGLGLLAACITSLAVVTAL